MLETSTISSSDFTDYTWPTDELARFRAYMASSEPLWSSQSADRNGKEARKAQLQAELTAFAKAMAADRRQLALGRMDRATLGRMGLKSIDRLHAYQLGHLEGLARFYARHPGADTAPGLISLICLESDNDDYGACYLSIPRMAEVLSRTTDSIREAIDRLAADGIIRVEERSGGSTLHWPVVHPSFVTKVSLQWVVDVYSPPRTRGRPRKIALRREGEPFSEKPPGAGPEGFSGTSENPSPPRPKTPPPALETTLLFDHPNKNNTAVPLETVDQTKAFLKKTKPRSRIVSTWEPSPEDRAWVQFTYVATERQIAEQAERFRDYHQGKGSLMADWAAAWRTWWGNGFHQIAKRVPPSAPMPAYWWRENPAAVTAIGNEGWRQLVMTYSKGGWQVPMLGPSPGTKGCVAPPEVLRELKLTASSTGGH